MEISQKNKMNFIEISMALQMINKKVEYEQFKMMFEFNIEGLVEKRKGGNQMGCIDNGQCRDGRLLAQHNTAMQTMQKRVSTNDKREILYIMLQGDINKPGVER